MQNALGPLSPQAEEAIRSLEWADYQKLVNAVMEVTGVTVTGFSKQSP
jgi:hypothetical protein